MKFCIVGHKILLEGSVSHFSYFGLKPIFHCDAKLLALGTFASANAKDSTFALPNTKNTNMLVSLVLGDASFLRWPCTFDFLCVDFIHFQWNIGGIWSSGVGHVYFMYISCLCIIFRVGYAKISRRKGRFQWNIGFSFYFMLKNG